MLHFFEDVTFSTISFIVTNSTDEFYIFSKHNVTNIECYIFFRERTECYNSMLNVTIILM